MTRICSTIFLGVGVALCVSGMVACTTTEPGWDVPHYEKTGVEPQIGSYVSPDLPTAVHVVDRGGGLYVRFSRDGYTSHMCPIVDGAFYGEWGQINGTHCPTDAFCISGHFTSSTSASGSYRTGAACRPSLEIVTWTAELATDP